MSTDEQMAAIGRLIVERTEANRQCALLADEIKKWGIKISNLSGNIQSPEDPAKLIRSIELIDGLIGSGGLDRLQTITSEYRNLHQRVSDIGQTLRNAGAE
jgi:hypothetical protein